MAEPSQTVAEVHTRFTETLNAVLSYSKFWHFVANVQVASDVGVAATVSYFVVPSQVVVLLHTLSAYAVSGVLSYVPVEHVVPSVHSLSTWLFPPT